MKCSSAVLLSSKYLPTIYEASLHHPSNWPILNFILFTPGSLDTQHFPLVVDGYPTLQSWRTTCRYSLANRSARETSVCFLCKNCLGRMVENELDRCKESASRTCSAAANAVPCSCPCIKRCLSLSSSPKSLCSAPHLDPRAGVFCVRKQVQTKLSEGQRITQRLFHSWPRSLVDAGLRYISSSLHRGP